MLVLLARPSVVCRACRAVPARPLAVALAPSHPHPRTRTAPALVPTALRHHRLHPEHTRAVHLSAAASSPAAQTTVGPSSSVAAESVPDPGRVVDTALVHAPEAPAEPAVTEGAPAHISLTARAADRLGGALAADLTQGALRLAVEPGGCHGYQYKIALDAEQDEDDFVFEAAPGARVVVDSTTLHLIKGSVVDFVTELIGSQFIIRDNPQAKGAGCGCGVSWEPK